MGAVAEVIQPPSLLAKVAAKYSVDPGKMMSTLKATAFKGDVSNEQMMALLIVADQYSLNPWTKEIYAFPDKNNGIVPVVGVDGWLRIINEHPQFDGLEFNEVSSDDGKLPLYTECVIYRKDRSHPTKVREYFGEVKRGTQPWQSHPRRMLRHKALIQCARVAFGYAGIYDQDEAERIVEGSVREVDTAPVVADLNSRLESRRAHVVDVEPAPGETDEQPALTLAKFSDIVRAARDANALDLAEGYIDALPADQQAEARGLVEHQRKAIG